MECSGLGLERRAAGSGRRSMENWTEKEGFPFSPAGAGAGEEYDSEEELKGWTKTL
ncbi:hypothetical protein ACJ73_10232 [Blastomyces percursus]|uniref:Uncharacterized protein n=1 Tax=Blastomyces percursus TaxID=1658174 RepID=A0A1J9PZX4_9EURO|nr:hypothetical protein ACJ73_10232 [Blastomyces percursus]